MKKFIFASLALAFVVGLVACRKSDNSVVAPSATITIVSPGTSEDFQPGDTINIQATITANATLHGYHIAIVNRETGDSVFHASSHEHASTLTVNEQWVNDLGGAADLRLYISSAINHDGLEAAESIDFSSKLI
jgi:hypothetical protein